MPIPAYREPAVSEATPRRDIAEIFREHGAFVGRVLRRLDVPASEIDDALQDVFLTVAAQLAEYEERGAMRAWLFTIARQIASHARRANARRSKREQMAQRLDAAAPSTPEQQLTDRQAADLIKTFLGTLPAEQAMAFYLSEVEGLSAPEIAACEAANLNTIYARVRLARRRFAAFVAALNAKEVSDG